MIINSIYSMHSEIRSAILELIKEHVKTASFRNENWRFWSE